MSKQSQFSSSFCYKCKFNFVYIKVARIIFCIAKEAMCYTFEEVIVKIACSF